MSGAVNGRPREKRRDDISTDWANGELHAISVWRQDYASCGHSWTKRFFQRFRSRDGLTNASLDERVKQIGSISLLQYGNVVCLCDLCKGPLANAASQLGPIDMSLPYTLATGASGATSPMALSPVMLGLSPASLDIVLGELAPAGSPLLPAPRVGQMGNHAVLAAAREQQRSLAPSGSIVHAAPSPAADRLSAIIPNPVLEKHVDMRPDTLSRAVRMLECIIHAGPEAVSTYLGGSDHMPGFVSAAAARVKAFPSQMFNEGGPIANLFFGHVSGFTASNYFWNCCISEVKTIDPSQPYQGTVDLYHLYTEYRGNTSRIIGAIDRASSGRGGYSDPLAVWEWCSKMPLYWYWVMRVHKTPWMLSMIHVTEGGKTVEPPPRPPPSHLPLVPRRPPAPPLPPGDSAPAAAMPIVLAAPLLSPAAAPAAPPVEPPPPNGDLLEQTEDQLLRTMQYNAKIRKLAAINELLRSCPAEELDETFYVQKRAEAAALKAELSSSM